MLEKPAYLLGDFIIEIGLARSTGLCIKEAVFGQLRERGPWFEPRPVHISL